MNHFYRQFEHTLLQGFDVEGDDPKRSHTKYFVWGTVHSGERRHGDCEFSKHVYPSQTHLSSLFGNQ